MSRNDPITARGPDQVYNALSNLVGLGQYLFNKSQTVEETSTAFQVINTAQAGLEALKRERESQRSQAEESKPC